MTKKHIHYLIAFVAGGFLFAPIWNGLRRIVSR